MIKELCLTEEHEITSVKNINIVVGKIVEKNNPIFDHIRNNNLLIFSNEMSDMYLVGDFYFSLTEMVENKIILSRAKIILNEILLLGGKCNIQVFFSTNSAYVLRHIIMSNKISEEKKQEMISLYRIDYIEKKYKYTHYDYDTFKESIESGWDVR